MKSSLLSTYAVSKQDGFTFRKSLVDQEDLSHIFCQAWTVEAITGHMVLHLQQMNQNWKVLHQ